MILVAVKDVEAGQHEFVLLLNEPIEELNVLLVCEVVVGEAVYELQQLLLVLWDGRHWPLHEGSKLLREPRELRAKLLLVDGPGYVAIDLSEDVHVLLQDKRLQKAGHLFV